jgi:DNA-binding NarL/FixJ family response regulator
MSNKIRVLIVDDHAMVRVVLSQAIERQRDLVLIGTAANGSEALELYRQHQPDVVTMDFKLPGMTGIECTAALRREFPAAKVLLLSIYEGSEDLWRATQAGAAGYLSKSVEIKEVLQAIRSVATGTRYFSAGLAEKLATRTADQSLSSRELEVLNDIVAGRSNKEISAARHLSQSTVKFHIANIFAKLQVPDRAQAISTAVQRGIVHLDAE